MILLKKINVFLFNYKPLLKANWVAKIIAFYCLIHIITLMPNLYELYGRNGMINQKVNDIFTHSFMPKLSWVTDFFISSSSERLFIYSFISIYVLSLVFIFLDTWAFYSAIVSWFCNLVLVNSSYILSHGGDSLTTFVLFLNLFFNCYAIVKNKTAFKHIYSFATRLLQIHLCYVYFFAGIGKVLVKDWFDGTLVLVAITFVLCIENFKSRSVFVCTISLKTKNNSHSLR